MSTTENQKIVLPKIVEDAYEWFEKIQDSDDTYDALGHIEWFPSDVGGEISIGDGNKIIPAIDTDHVDCVVPRYDDVYPGVYAHAPIPRDMWRIDENGFVEDAYVDRIDIGCGDDGFDYASMERQFARFGITIEWT